MQWDCKDTDLQVGNHDQRSNDVCWQRGVCVHGGLAITQGYPNCVVTDAGCERGIRRHILNDNW